MSRSRLVRLVSASCPFKAGCSASWRAPRFLRWLLVRPFQGFHWRPSGSPRRLRSSCSGTTRTGWRSGRLRSPSTRMPKCGCISRPAQSWADRTIPAWEILAGQRRLGAEARRQARPDRLERAGGGSVPSHRRRRAGAHRADPGGGDRADPDGELPEAAGISSVQWEALAMLVVGLLAVAVAVNCRPPGRFCRPSELPFVGWRRSRPLFAPTGSSSTRSGRLPSPSSPPM